MPGKQTSGARVHDTVCKPEGSCGMLWHQITQFPRPKYLQEPRMAKNRKSTPAVDKERAYIKGVAKNLVDRIYGPAGLPWGTKFTELEATVAAVREALTEEMLQQALARQAAQEERPPEYDACPVCGRPTRASDLPVPRRLETGAGDAVWSEPAKRQNGDIPQNGDKTGTLQSILSGVGAWPPARVGATTWRRLRAGGQAPTPDKMGRKGDADAL
jgi:hypothetical protein